MSTKNPVKSTIKKVQLFQCTYCHINFDNIWTNNNKTISCCRDCMGNNPIISRATSSIKFYPKK